MPRGKTTPQSCRGEIATQKCDSWVQTQSTEPKRILLKLYNLMEFYLIGDCHPFLFPTPPFWNGTIHYKLGEIYFLTVPKARSPRLRCPQGWFLVSSLFSWLAEDHLLPVFSHSLSSVCSWRVAGQGERERQPEGVHECTSSVSLLIRMLVPLD